MASSGDVELVIFDCDGVLVDSERISVDIDRRVLGELGWELTNEEIVHRFVGRSDAHFRDEVERYLGRSLDDDWAVPFLHLYRDAFERDLVAVPGVREALEALDLPTCVASSGSHDKIRRSLTLTDLLPRFDGRIFSADDVRDGKPAPDLFLHAAAQLGVVPGRCVVVEDSRFGVRAARAAGMRVLGYAGGITPGEWLAAEGATVFTDMRDLPELLTA